MTHHFNNLKIWKLSRILVKEIYLATKSFPKEERYGLTSQMQRAPVSVPSNIAEGCGRGTDGQLKHFIDISIGSICELETQVYLAFDLDYINEVIQNDLVNKIGEIRRMSIGFQNSL